MKAEDDFLVYNEDEAVSFILNHLDEETKKRVGEDEVEYILDVIYDFYDEKGFIDEDTTEEAKIDEEEMFAYILKALKKDKIGITTEDVQFILDGEYEYGKSIDIYNDDENEA